MRYKATFHGREKGAIGIFHKVTTTTEGADEHEATLALYDRFEHITGLKLTEKQATKCDQIQEALARHLVSLESLAKSLGVSEPNAERINRQLRKVERRAHDAATAQCNGERYGSQPFRDTDQAWDGFKADIRNEVAAIFGGHHVPGFFVNGDARGYALKIDNENVEGQKLIESARLHRDWGGYGILAPDLSEGY